MFVTDIGASLKEFISGTRRVAVLGIGNELRTDDGIGPFIIEGLNVENPNLLIENVGSVPEAFTRLLAKFKAERIIMIDAADMKNPPGHIEFITKDRIGGIAISTHSMPLSFLMMYLEQETGAQTILLGIQPQDIQFGEGLTPELGKVAQKIISTLNILLSDHVRGLKDV